MGVGNTLIFFKIIHMPEELEQDYSVGELMTGTGNMLRGSIMSNDSQYAKATMA